MSTRQSNTNPLIPLQDPEQLAREIRRCACLEATLAAPTAINIPSPNASTDHSLVIDPSTTSMNQSNQQGSSGDPSAPEEMSNNNLIQAILAVQSQARADVKAALDAWSKNVIPKIESTPTPQLAPGLIDLQQFKISDGPYFKGSFQEVEAFLCWIQALQIFFATKSVTHADDKRLIVGGLISETNLLSFYSNEFAKYEGKSWEDFKEQMFEFALPVEWTPTLKRNIAQLKMTEAKTFLEFSTRARTLQSLVNFDKHLLDDYELAEAVTFGLPEVLQAKIDDHQTLRSANFKYGEFESRTSGFYSNLLKLSALRLRRSASTTTASNRMVDTVWRLHAYLDSVGLCHFCKKHCGSAHRACPNPMDKSQVEIPALFVPPPKPADYTPPVAWTSKNSGPAKTNPSTAGRPIGRPAGVAGLTNEAPDLDELSASCLARVDEHLDGLAPGFANWHLTAVKDDMQAAAIAGDPDAIKTLAVSSATRDNEFIPEAPQFDEASFLEACGAIAESRSANSENTLAPTTSENAIAPTNPGLAGPQTDPEAAVFDAVNNHN
ncbi:hypothetical protein PTTG_05793 [Puccinia triticina 1-1 BBBD Race 1]|uniref:Retrotransposon gag domain-containing protein n=1 Tax=Puccinia triticina (isolate 1-1 / race 1 (BBBD)) TaxID=630390 RepID=A0A180FZZ3_PUCT1|nr:hypothetical protein PTTG_05793 [Puccinia triticina 1-1 BBBD Race 1]